MHWTRLDVLPEELRRALFEWEPDPFRSKIWNLTWRPQQEHLVSWDGEHPASHIGLVRETVHVNNEPVPVGGIAGVLTLPGYRGRGLAQSGLQKAEEFFARQWNLHHALLFCFPAMQSFYESLGWTCHQDPVHVEQPQGTVLMPARTMVKALNGATWPSGPIKIPGFPW